MTNKEVISQLESLIEDRKSFLDSVDDEIYRDDIEALEKAIEELKKKCAFDRGFECSALTHKNCTDCKFYKTYEQLAEEQKISVIRLKVLDIRQNTGKTLPFFLAAATKEKTTDLDIVEIPQSYLDFELEHFKENIQFYDSIKRGLIEPERCEHCDYCKQTKVLRTPTTLDMLTLEG